MKASKKKNTKDCAESSTGDNWSFARQNRILIWLMILFMWPIVVVGLCCHSLHSYVIRKHTTQTNYTLMIGSGGFLAPTNLRWQPSQRKQMKFCVYCTEQRRVWVNFVNEFDLKFKGWMKKTDQLFEITINIKCACRLCIIRIN